MTHTSVSADLVLWAGRCSAFLSSRQHVPRNSGSRRLSEVQIESHCVRYSLSIFLHQSSFCTLKGFCGAQFETQSTLKLTLVNTSLTKNTHFLLLHVIEKCVTIKIKWLQLYFDLKWEFMFSYSWCWIKNTKVLRTRLRKNLFGSTSRRLLLYCSNHSLYIFKREGCSKLWQSHHLQPSFLYNFDQLNLSFC